MPKSNILLAGLRSAPILLLGYVVASCSSKEVGPSEQPNPLNPMPTVVGGTPGDSNDSSAGAGPVLGAPTGSVGAVQPPEDNGAGGAAGAEGQQSGSGGLTQGGTATGGGVSTSAGTSTDGGGSAEQGRSLRVPQMTNCDGETSGLHASKIYYVTPEGNGGGGSFDDAMSLSHALAAVEAGQMVLLQPGTYTIAVVSDSKRNTIELFKSGTEDAPIYLVAAHCGRAKFDFSYPADEWQSGDGKSFGFHLKGNYWYLKNLDVENAGYHGIWIGGTTADPTGGTHNTIENCTFFNNRNTGLEINSGGAYNTIINVDSYANYDFKLRDDGTMGGMADGFASKQEQGPGNQFLGCRAWSNSDDGFDTYANTEAVNIEYSWAFSNGIDIWGSSFWESLGATFRGNGNGFKLGGSGAKQMNRVVHSVAFGNPQNGFDLNSNIGGQTLYNNIGYGNGKNYDFDSTLDAEQEHVFRNNVSLGGQSDDVFLDADSAYNSWNGIDVTVADFVSLDLTLATAPRNPDGSLPLRGLFQPATESALRDAGIDVGMMYNGSAPDLGPFESE